MQRDRADVPEELRERVRPFVLYEPRGDVPAWVRVAHHAARGDSRAAKIDRERRAHHVERRARVIDVGVDDLILRAPVHPRVDETDVVDRQNEL